LRDGLQEVGDLAHPRPDEQDLRVDVDGIGAGLAFLPGFAEELPAVVGAAARELELSEGGPPAVLVVVERADLRAELSPLLPSPEDDEPLEEEPARLVDPHAEVLGRVREHVEREALRPIPRERRGPLDRPLRTLIGPDDRASRPRESVLVPVLERLYDPDV